MENYLTSGTTPKGKLTGSAKGFGYIIAAAGIGAIIWFLYYIAPVITTAILNTTDLLWASVKLAALAVAVIGAIVIVWKNRNMISYWYNVLIKWTWTQMIESNPIAGMRYAYDKWQRQADELNKTIELLEGREQLITAKMDKRQKEAKSYFEAGLKAKEMAGKATGEEADDLSDAANANAQMAQRRKESIDVFLPRLKTIQSALTFSKKLHEAWTRGLKLLKDDINIKEEDLQDLKTIAGAFETAQSIISGNTNERGIYEESVKIYSRQISEYVGKCRRTTELLKDYAVNVDVQNAVEVDAGQKFLNEYDLQKFSAELDYKKLLDASPSRAKISMGQSVNQFQKAMEIPDSAPSFNKFGDLS